MSDLGSDPWAITEAEVDLDRLGWSESIFALANGHIGLRGNLDEGEPYGYPGTYVNSVHERRPFPASEPGYGMPESGQTLLNVTNGKIMRLLVDDEPFDVRYGTIRSHTRRLDLRTGCLHRVVEWTSPAGQAVRVTSTRIVSLSQRSIAAIRYEVEAIDESARIVVQSELVAGEPQPLPRLNDPRVEAVLDHPLHGVDHSCRDGNVVLVHRTAASGIGLAAAMGHEVSGPGTTAQSCDSSEDLGRVTFTAPLEAGERLTIVKYVAYGWSSERSDHALRDQVAAAIEAARHTGWDGLLLEQREVLDDLWDSSDIEVEGDEELQQAVRVATFHAFQAGARSEGRPIAAKGLTGRGYDGHAFWDTEVFLLPVLTQASPAAAADALRWRHSTLPIARERAASLGLAGAAFPWRTIDGHECSGYWPAGTAAFHVNSAVADAVVRYVESTGDVDFEVSVGAELLVETARLWRSLGHFDRYSEFRIDGVTGPDEYSAVVDNNVYTNLMAARNLLAAADVVARHDAVAEALGVEDDEIAGWRSAAAAMRIPYDERLGVHPQSEGFTDHQHWPFETTPADCYPLFQHRPYFDLYRKQVVKQADLVLAMYLQPDAFDVDDKRRNFEYYERLTVRDSSLSAIAQSVMAAEVGHLDLALAYARETAMLDLADLHENAADGLHIAAMAGSRTTLVAGFGGLRLVAGVLRFAPRLPSDLRRLRFSVRHHGRMVRVEILHESVTYELVGEPMTIEHCGEVVQLGSHPVVVPLINGPSLPGPPQPFGREPGR